MLCYCKSIIRTCIVLTRSFAHTLTHARTRFCFHVSMPSKNRAARQLYLPASASLNKIYENSFLFMFLRFCRNVYDMLIIFIRS